MSTVAARLLAWYRKHGRHDLPWQHPRSAYRVWIAEIMLQQTRVQTVVPYYQRFIAALPDLPSLAAADEDRVLALWSGLGYYRRARFAQRAAIACVERHGGQLPRFADALLALPGIGRSTANAILAQAFGQPRAILDGNVKRVLARFHGIRGWSGEPAVERELWALAERHTPTRKVADYTQAIMDLGATVCTRVRPHCEACPLRADCVAHRDDLTAVLPQRKPRKPLPSRATHMLLLRDAVGRVLLERRDGFGVWPRLWSLPECASDATGVAAARLARVTRVRARRLPPFAHTFSHYRLHIQPLLWTPATPLPRVADNDVLRWCAARDWPEMALPAPVRRLLQTLEDATNPP